MGCLRAQKSEEMPCALKYTVLGWMGYLEEEAI